MVNTIDYINGNDEFDGCLWFFDGKYAGHEGQIDIFTHVVGPGEEVYVQLRHRKLKPDVEGYEILDADYTNLENIEHYLQGTV